MRKPFILALALSPFVQAEPVSEVSPVGKIDGMVSLPVTGMKAVESNLFLCQTVAGSSLMARSMMPGPKSRLPALKKFEKRETRWT